MTNDEAEWLTTAVIQWTSPRTTRHDWLEWNYRSL